MNNLGEGCTQCFEDFKLWDFALEQREKGLIRHPGFALHDSADALDKILTWHPEVEFVQLQINYADWDSPSVQSRKCFEVALKHKKPVIVMEPVKGGALAKPPAKVADCLEEVAFGVLMSSFAIRYAASLDNVITVLSGMSSLERMEDNLRTMTDFRPLNEREREAVGKAQAALKSISSIPCTNCRYCVKGCPVRIDIPGIMNAMNQYITYDNLRSAMDNYRWVTRDGIKAGDCVACGQCEEVCPQHIGIIGELRRAAEVLK